jgi:endonuclease/exonuclease/phosphatase family metal-dependent hydrolase
VFNVHLITPRDTLEAFRHGALSEVIQEGTDTAVRLGQAAELAEAVRKETGPVIVAGDFNSPEQRLAVRRLLDAGLRDAFSERGTGYGYTFGPKTRLGHSLERIDHILVSKHFAVRQCLTGEPVTSDHHPVFAELVLH